MRPSHFLPLQLAALIASANANLESGISEIDLIIPAPNATYEIGANGRFPLVWAISNPSLWLGGDASLQFVLTDIDDPKGANAPLGTILDFDKSWDLRSNDNNSTRYITAEVHVKQDGRYSINWGAAGTSCNSPRGFHNGSHSPSSEGWKFNFTTKAGGQKADFSSAAAANCSARTAVAYNIAVPNTGENCRQFDDVDPFPSPAPCDLQMPDDKTVATVTQSLDQDFNESCYKNVYPSYCPQPLQKSGTSVTGIGSGVLLGLGMSMAVLSL